MMERLTREMTFEEEYIILQKEVKELFDKEDRESEPPENNCVVRRALRCIKKLVSEVEQYKDYKDLDEQGLLLRLPCKLGDTVWDNDFGKPCKYTITGFSFGTGEDYIDEPVSEKEVVYYYSNYSGSITGSFAVSELGNTVFLTQAEAKQKLQEMEVNDMTKGLIKGIYEAAKQESIKAKLFILLCVSYGGEQVLEWIKGSD